MTAAHRQQIALHPAQLAIFKSPAMFKVCAAGRRFGKSHLAAWMLLLKTMETENAAGRGLMDVATMYIAPTFDQAKRAVWNKLLTLGKMESQGGLIRNFNTNDGWMDLVSGRRLYVKGADNPETLRGVGLSFCVMDEYADMKSYVWDEIIEPTLVDVEGEALFIGTPKGRNHFYRLFMNAMHVGVPGDDRYKASEWEDWEAFHFPSSDNPFISQDRLRKIVSRSGKSADTVRQELEASFIQGGPRVLDVDQIPVVDQIPGLVVRREAMGNRLVVDEAQGSTFVTVDLAGYVRDRGKVTKNDETVICTTYVTDFGDWFVLDMQHGQWDPRDVALRIMRAVQKARPCRLGIEQGALSNALGPYLDEEIRRFNIFVTPEPLKHGQTKKQDRINWALQGRIERGKLTLLQGPWNEWFLDQAASFPSPLAHDDGLDALAYVDQMAVATWGAADDYNDSEWEPVDLIAGY